VTTRPLLGQGGTEQQLDTSALRKARGAFFTPDALCDYIAEWAIRSPDDSILEPSCGEAAFLVAAARRLDELAVRPGQGQLHGVELHAASSHTAQELVRATGRRPQITTADFFDVHPKRRHAAVIGNPPYVRYQDFAGDTRTRARAAALAAGVPLTGLASSWAAFTVHAAEFLAPGGRLGLVLPAELLTVNYAAEVRRYLMQRFGRVRLVLFTERVFPGVQEEVVLLLAEDALAPGGTTHCELRQVRNAAELLAVEHRATAIAGSYRWTPRPTHGKWTQALLPEAALRAYTAVEANNQFTTLANWGDTTLGMVTGNNRYFALSPSRVAELNIPESELLPLSPPGSRHLRGLTLARSAWTELGKADTATWLFRPPVNLSDCSRAARDYIRQGEEAGVPNAYKCRVRTPWWRVPLVPPADLMLTYMNADTPRLTTNRARVHHLNSVHGVYLRTGRKALGADLLPLASLNTMTLLGAETVGRAYGGGMLKLEPKEADLLPVPSPEVLESCRDALTALRPQMAVALRNSRLTDAAQLVDSVLLIGALGMSRPQVALLEKAHHDLTARRMARARTPRVDADVQAMDPRPAAEEAG
jgi:adenine-specific DNA-methyltransferase